MTPHQVALQLVAPRALGKALGCGCLALAALAALPLVLIAAMVGGALPGQHAGSAAASNDLPAPRLLVVGGEPLRPGTFKVTQGFGCTQLGLEPAAAPPYACPPDSAHPTFMRFHTGIDLAAPTGTVVYAVSAGSVQVINSTTGFGVHIVLTPATAATDAPVTYLYGHLSGSAVPSGAQVRSGEPIGFVGSTGNSTGAHLHFEADVGRRPVNPCSAFPAGYLPPQLAAAECLAWAL